MLSLYDFGYGLCAAGVSLESIRDRTECTATMATFGGKCTLAIVLLLTALCDKLLAVSAPYGGTSTVSSAEVVNHTKFTQDDTRDLYVKLTVGMSGQGLGENVKIRPTSVVASRGSECYKNHPMKNIDSDKLIFKQVGYLSVMYV